MTIKPIYIAELWWENDNAGHYVSSNCHVITIWIKNSDVRKWLSEVALQLPVLVAIYLYTVIVIFTIAWKLAMENICHVRFSAGFNKNLEKKFFVTTYEGIKG